jgi:hypothetical protein
LRAGPPLGPGRVRGPDAGVRVRGRGGAVVFTNKLEKGIGYKFRYESADGKTKETGAGKLFEKYKRLPGKDPGEVVDDGGELWFKAGPFEVEWSVGGEGRGWIYYSPEKVRVHIAHAKHFDKLDLKRFAK